MKRKYKLPIEIIGFLVLLFLGVSIIQDILLIVFSFFDVKINEFAWYIIRFVSSITLIYLFSKRTAWGKDVDNFLIDIEKRIKKMTNI